LEQERPYLDEEDGSWYFGKARDEFRKKKDSQAAPREEEDPIQWARDRRNAEQDRDTEFAPDDYLGGRVDDADEFSDTILLLLLCLAVSVLIYVRTRIVDRMRRDQQQQQPQPGVDAAPAGANGVFPPPGPDRDEWAVLR
jgi:SEL1 protein